MGSSDSGNGIFPDDIIIQIAARLPIKSLFRCKSICKFWCKIPSDPFFIQLHSQISSTRSGVLLELIRSFSIQSTFVSVDRLNGVSGFSLEFLKERVKIRASCNGLLCCSSVPNRGVYYVCNPMTREWVVLPRTRERPVTRYHPDDEVTLVGLAFNPCTLKFNVVLAGFYRSFGRRPLDCLVCLIFDSQTNLWRRSISTQNDEFTHMNKNQVVFAHGSLHWLTQCCSYILVLDLNDEVWTKIPLPEAIAGGSSSRIYLLELDGSISIIQIEDVYMTIWVLKDYKGQEWVVADRVSLRCIKGFIPSIFPISQSGEYVFLATPKQILLYNRGNKVWKEVYSVKNTVTYPLWFSSYAFKSTLFSCHHGAEYSKSIYSRE